MDTFEEDEYIPPGPGLPGWVHRISGPAWVFVGLAALVAVARLGRVHLLEPDHPWGVDDGFALADILGDVLLVLVPVILLHRRPAAWTKDRTLAVAAVVIAAQPILGLVPGLLLRWLTMGDDLDVDALQSVWLLMAVPGWLVAIAGPLLIVWGFDRLDERPPARFPRSRVALAVCLVTLFLASARAASVMLVAAAGAEISIGWPAFAGEIPSLALSAAWAWAALAALASGRAHRGSWWLLLLVSVILASLVPLVLWSLLGLLGPLAEEFGPWSDGIGVIAPLGTLASAAGASRSRVHLRVCHGPPSSASGCARVTGIRRTPTRPAHRDGLLRCSQPVARVPGHQPVPGRTSTRAVRSDCERFRVCTQARTAAHYPPWRPQPPRSSWSTTRNPSSTC